MRYLILLLIIGSAQAQEIGTPEYFSLLRERCKQYGFEAGTQAFSNCIMNLDQIVKQRQLDRQNMILQQGIQEEAVRRYGAMPLCSQLPPGSQGFARAQGSCR